MRCLRGLRIEAGPLEGSGEQLIQAVDRELCLDHAPQRLFEKLPSLDLVEDLEEQDAQNGIAQRKLPPVNDVLNQILADAITRSVDIRELVLPQYGIRRPWGRL
jgi:hypothetical protein